MVCGVGLGVPRGGLRSSIRTSRSGSWRLFLREWYMHPNGQIPAYEWAFSDVNPPVHAWACWRVFKIDARLKGKPDHDFLESVFHKLLMNFTWWVNRKDSEGANIFEGGFLGLDNIGVFDRSAPLPSGWVLEQSDGTSWMGMFCLNMLRIALRTSHHQQAYEDIASKFFEHFLYIAAAINHIEARACGTKKMGSTTTACAWQAGRTPAAAAIDCWTAAAVGRRHHG